MNEVNKKLDELAKRYDNGEFRGPGEYLAAVTAITKSASEPAKETCRNCGHVKDHEACNGRVE